MISLIENYLRFNFHGALGVAVGFYDLVLGTFVLLHAPTRKMNRSLFLVALTTSVWILTFAMMSLVRKPDDAYPWLAVCYFGVPFIAPSMYLFSTDIAEKPRQWVRLILGFAAASFAMLMFLCYPRELCYFKDFSWGRYPIFWSTTWVRLFSYFVIGFFFTFAGLTVRNLVKSYRCEAVPKNRTLLRVILIGFLLSYFGTLDWLTALGFGIYPVGYVALSLFVTAITYAIVRHQAFQINVLVKKFSAIVIVYAGLFSVLLPIGFIFLTHLRGLTPQEQASMLLILSCLFGVILSMGPAIYAFLVRHTFWLRYQSSTGLVHELKSPIGAIQGILDILIGNGGGQITQEKNLEYLHMIQKNTGRLELFVNDLLHLARLQDGQVDLQLKPTALLELVEEVAERYRPQIERKGLSLDLHLESVAETWLDGSKIRQVASNLISNALKFTTAGGICVRLVGADTNVFLSVSDTGKGIAPGRQEKIFERFFQCDPGEGGTGLGLTIAKAWVEAHGGRIWAESPGPGMGTTVTLTLPKADQEIEKTS